MIYLSLRDQLREERRKNEAMQSALETATANLDYIAMMTDVDLDEETEEVEVNE